MAEVLHVPVLADGVLVAVHLALVAKIVLVDGDRRARVPILAAKSLLVVAVGEAAARVVPVDLIVVHLITRPRVADGRPAIVLPKRTFPRIQALPILQIRRALVGELLQVLLGEPVRN